MIVHREAQESDAALPAGAAAGRAAGPEGRGGAIRRVARLLLAGVFLAVAACGADGGGDTGGSATAGSATPGTGQAAGGADTAPRDSVRAESSSLSTIRVGGIPVRVEIADEEEERQRGLMHRDSLGADEGMLFVYPEQRTLSFWMRNTRIPLSIAFADRRGVIVDIQQMDPNTEELHRSRSPAMYALEMNRGWFREHGVTEGDRIRF